MRSLVLSLFVAGQLTLAAPPALAAGPGSGDQTRLGVFSGVQVQVPLGGARAEAPRASLGIAPMARSERFDGSSRILIGEGLRVSLTPNRPAELTLAGTRLDRFRLTPGAQTPDGQKAGVSTLGWIGIGVGAVVVLTGGFYYWLSEEMECGPGEC